MRRADLLSGGRPVTLEEMLLARDRRAARQQRLLALYHQPVVSFTLVAPGPVKNSPKWRSVADAACDAVFSLCLHHDWHTDGLLWSDANSGPEWMMAVCASPLTLKEALVGLEQAHPLGRLWDVDVIDVAGVAVSRRELNLPGRRCLLCENNAHVCARARTHSLDLLLDEITQRIENYERDING
ncbi:citrate lyase holo-[acyl-carrier protein] synthase [Pseudocitrobacter cyperus]|uniref:Apo-citrate lyase phosphoribosyl-dephospho-CoA transferase n=1 Tax=Pseudocitrobacter cyperus TaxID=3112843 RepID=A0ABV0HJE1_9ENTR